MDSNINSLMAPFYLLPLWMQLYYQNENDSIRRGQMRMTTKKLCNPLLLCEKDINYAKQQYKLGWYHTTRDFFMIADDSEEGIKLYNHYHKVFLNLKKNIYFLQAEKISNNFLNKDLNNELLVDINESVKLMSIIDRWLKC